ncbi:MAG: cytochrome c3 family protein [Candidatus Hydrogenedentes bacterium]|nr:cytochrome c3 family protein [Candidatus Hydrogenedentota bacterium]
MRISEVHKSVLGRSIFFLGVAVAITGIVSALTQSTRSESPHNRGGDCAQCHLNDATEALARGERLIYTSDIDTLCQKCHEVEAGLSHPSGMVGTADVPDNFPLDWAGRITCVTCHYAHRESRPDVTGYMIRGEKVGRQYCESCHSDLASRVGSKHLFSYSRSHLGATRGQASARSLLDEVSLQCLGCHDGVVGSSASLVMGSSKGTWQHASIGLSHPIGVPYPPRDKRRTKYKPTASLDSRIRLFDQKLGCCSCHDAYSKSKHGLVMSNEKSALCLACHLV